MAIVAADKNFDIYLSSTPPSQIRFRVLNANSNFKLRISFYHPTFDRIDLYKNSKFVAPTNSYYSNSKMILFDPTSKIASLKPTYLNESGTNLYYKYEKKMFFTMSGSDVIDLKKTVVVNLKFSVPQNSDDAFFDPVNLVKNFAKLLGVDESKIRRVEIVSASRKRRSPRDINDKQIIISIYENPVDLITDKDQITTIENNFVKLESEIINKFTTGQLQAYTLQQFGVQLNSLVMEKTILGNSTEIEITKIKKVLVVQEAAGCNAQVPCSTQPILKILDENVIIF